MLFSPHSSAILFLFFPFSFHHFDLTNISNAQTSTASMDRFTRLNMRSCRQSDPSIADISVVVEGYRHRLSRKCFWNSLCFAAANTIMCDRLVKYRKAGCRAPLETSELVWLVLGAIEIYRSRSRDSGSGILLPLGLLQTMGRPDQ